MKNLIIHPNSLQMLNVYLKQPTHALLISGKNGVGLGTIAKTLAKNIPDSDLLVIMPTQHNQQKTANINVDDLKDIQKITRDKRTAPLAVVIDEAEKMTARTPEAFLKLLEEPGSNIHFILTSHNVNLLPKTILSRVQQIEILPVKKPQTNSIISEIKPLSKQKQIEFMAYDTPAEIHRLRGDDEYFRAKARFFEQAKQFLNANIYNRLKISSELKTREDAIWFVESLARLTEILAQKTNKTPQLEILCTVLENLYANGNLKSQLTFLALNF